MSKFTNFVRGELVDAIDTDPATAVKVAFASPFQPPADPVGQRARLVLMDDARRPTKFEVIAFTSYTTFDDVQTLIGVERGVDGTTAQSWSAGAVVGQDLPAAMLEILTAQPTDDHALMLGADDLFTYGEITYADVVGKAFRSGHVVLKGRADVPTVDTGKATLFLDSATNDLKVAFDDGTSQIVASPPP